MSNRSYQLCLRIDNGVTRRYRLRPLAAAELPTPFVAGFRLGRHAADGGDLTDPPAYFVRLAGDGAVNCTCPQWQKTERCKHADALVAAGVLPVALVQLLQARTRLLDDAEARAQSALARCLALENVPEAVEVPSKKPWRQRRS